MRCQEAPTSCAVSLAAVVELHVGADLEGVGLAVVGRLRHLGAEIADVLGGRRRIVRRDADQHAVVWRRGMHRGEGRLAMAVEARRRVGRNHVDERSAAFGRLRPRGNRSDRRCQAEARSQKSRTKVHLPPPVQPDSCLLLVTLTLHRYVIRLAGARTSRSAHLHASAPLGGRLEYEHERTWRSALRQVTSSSPHCTPPNGAAAALSRRVSPAGSLPRPWGSVDGRRSRTAG